MPSNLSKAVQYYQEAADKQDAEGMYRLALCYAEGKAVPADRKEALRLCRRALNSADLEEQEDQDLRSSLNRLISRLEKA